MRTVHFRSLSIAAVAVLTFAGSVAAQEKPSGLLNNLEVRNSSNAQSRATTRARAHFTALADRYAAEAKRHTSMAQSFVGNPSRNLGTGMSAHCKQLADLNTQSATELRELAAYHQKLASGVTATPPTGAHASRVARAPAPTEQELNAMAAKASTPADHRALEEYFLTLAKRYTADATSTSRWRTPIAARRSPRRPCIATVSRRLSRDAAKEATAAAEMHKQLAGVGR